LVEIYAYAPEPLFGKNDFVGQNIKKITNRLGNTFIKKNNFIIYSNYKNKILVLYAPFDKVVFFKFLRLNNAIPIFTDIQKGILKQNI